MAETISNLWPEEREAARPPERLTVSQWADRYRHLPPDTPHPGRWRTSFTPYLREIMDGYADLACEDLILMGGTQWGKTQTLINCLLYSIDQDPAPTLFVMPSETDAVSFATNHLKRAIEFSPRMARYKSQKKRDWLAEEININGVTLYFGWAQSPTRLASRSIGRLFLDEVDKYPRFAGREADPISLATERLRWWSDRKRVIASTPVHQDDYIYPLWKGGDRRVYHVPCPHCSAWQPLVFSPESLQWPKGERDPERIKQHGLAYYVCQKCARPIEDTQANRRRMIDHGVWCPEDGEVLPGGEVHANLATRVRSYHINALYSPMLTWSDVAAQFLRSKDDARLLMNFTNSWLGWPWVEKSEETTLDRLAGRITSLSRGQAPRGTVVVTAGVDVGKHVMHYTIRAWCMGERSHTIEEGIVDRWETLAAVLLGQSWADEDGVEHDLRLACIDSGYRTDQVYGFCLQTNPGRCRPVKGVDHLASPLRASKIERDAIGHATGLMLWSIDTTYLKDKFTTQIHTDLGTPGSWSMHAEPHDDYLRHLCAEHKVIERSRKSKSLRTVWAPRPGGGPNHWWDAEIYAQAAGEMVGVYTLREKLHKEPEPPAPDPAPANPKQGESWIRRPITEAPRRRGGWIR